MSEFIDLSSNNNPQNFTAIKKAGIEGVWIKVGGGGETHAGSIYNNPYFKPWASRARSAGLRVGGYWFAVPTLHDARLQAREFVKALGPTQRRDLRPVLDFEKNLYGLSNSQLEEWAHTFSQEVKLASGVGPLYYSYASFLHAVKPVGYGLWLADYSNPNPPAPSPWKKYVAHQYTDRGSVAGVQGFVDRSRAPRLRPLLAHPLKGLV